ncbi:hypothetical protein KAI58_03085 [Candidatus Gracilibacteria bacterium]|nr:hypothetical protein [Candidatus Gracilibacteria bacterium]
MNKRENSVEITNSFPDIPKDQAIKETIISEVEEIIRKKREEFDMETKKALKLIEKIKTDSAQQTENAIKTLEKEHTEVKIQYQKEKDVLQKQRDELKDIETALSKVSKLTRLYYRWENNGIVAQWFVAKYLIKPWVEKHEKQYDELKKTYDEKWDKGNTEKTKSNIKE